MGRPGPKGQVAIANEAPKLVLIHIQDGAGFGPCDRVGVAFGLGVANGLPVLGRSDLLGEWVGCDELLGLAVHALDVRVDLGHLDPPLATTSELDGRQVTTPHQGVCLRRRDRDSSATSSSFKNRRLFWVSTSSSVPVQRRQKAREGMLADNGLQHWRKDGNPWTGFVGFSTDLA